VELRLCGYEILASRDLFEALWAKFEAALYTGRVELENPYPAVAVLFTSKPRICHWVFSCLPHVASAHGHMLPNATGSRLEGSIPVTTCIGVAFGFRRGSSMRLGSDPCGRVVFVRPGSLVKFQPRRSILNFPSPKNFTALHRNFFITN
jgi:hypothetical protein